MFKDAGDNILDELSEIKASSPYAEGKLRIHEKLKEYRTESGLYLVSGIMFNHESPRRPDEYLFSQISKKVIRNFKRTKGIFIYIKSKYSKRLGLFTRIC